MNKCNLSIFIGEGEITILYNFVILNIALVHRNMYQEKRENKSFKNNVNMERLNSYKTRIHFTRYLTKQKKKEYLIFLTALS